MDHHLLILGWHNVEGTWAFPAESGSGTRGLRKQLGLLRRVATVVALDAALEDLVAGRSLPPRAVALTFDDGYRDNLDIALPMLQEFGLPATFFLVPGVLDGEITPWWETLGHAFTTTRKDSLDWDGTAWSLAGAEHRRSYDRVATRLKQLQQTERLAAVDEIIDRLGPPGDAGVPPMFLDWDGARELAQRGAAIGAHSRDHAILANESADAQRRNLAEARQSLETGLQRTVDLLAYPNGTPADFGDVTIDAARSAGFRCGVTTIPGWNSAQTPPYQLKRQVMFPERGPIGFKPLVKRAVLDARSLLLGR
jgi:peptidoglycan/xylan/chitin deacetylase (PgdA/CDA1 family)